MSTRVRVGLAFFLVAAVRPAVGTASPLAQQAATASPQPTPPAPPSIRIPDARRTVDLERPGVPVYLDAELPVTLEVKALIPTGKYRSRIVAPVRLNVPGSYPGGGWRILFPFRLQALSDQNNEGCGPTYAELKAIFDSATSDEALRRRDAFVARKGVCPVHDAMMTRQVKGLNPELAQGLRIVPGQEMTLEVQRIDGADQVLKTYRWPLLPAVVAPVVVETEWIVTEVAARIATYLNAGATPSVSRMPVGLTQFEVRTANRSPATLVNVASGPWNPASYVPLAQALAVTRRTAPDRVYSKDLAATLGTPTIENLLVVNRQLGIALRSDPRNPSTHEAAALFVVSVALRSASSGLEDIRPLLNRAAAHLALASVDGRPLGVEGELALAGVEALGGREVPAAARLSALPAAAASSAIGSWKRALTMRATGDWRIYNAAENPSFLEQLEHARALTRSWTEERAAAFRREHGGNSESALWARAILKDATSIELGHQLAMPRVYAEQEEVRRLANSFGDDDPDHWLQATGETRGLDPISPDLWARLAEASLADAAWKAERFLSGLPPSPAADAFQARFSETLPRSMAFQALNASWQFAKQTPAADRGCEEIALQIKEDPFRLSVRLHALAARACGAMPRRFPSVEARITPWTPAGTIFDHRNRLEVGDLASSFGNTDWRLKRKLTFFDPDVLDFAVGRTERRETVSADYRAFGQEMGYSLTLFRHWRYSRTYEGSASEALEPGRTACLLEVNECLPLIELLRTEGRDEEAFATAARVFAKTSPITVGGAIGSPWVVDEYLKRGQVAEAQDVADRAGSIGSFSGMRVQARLAERLGQIAVAERLYQEIDETYPKAEAAAFRMRRLFRENKDRAKAAKALAGIGEPMTLRMGPGEDFVGLPAGIWLSELALTGRGQAWRLGIRRGDLIVKVNGFDITNELQLWAVLSLDDRQEIAVTVLSDSRPEKRTALQGPFWHARYGPVTEARQARR